MKTTEQHLEELREQLKDTLSVNCSGAMDILRHYGAPNQLLKLAEECRELEQAAIVAHRDLIFDSVVEGSHEDNLKEEIVDVLIMAYQIMRWLNDDNAIREIVQYKIQRQLDRIAKEKGGAR